MGATALNAYAGQAGFYIIEDAALERRFRLPQGAYDIPLMVQSRFYTAAGNITDESHELTSTYGDTYSINGQILPHLVVEPRKYRFRILNASASRSFNYTLSAQAKGASAADTVPVPMYVVASDSGFLSHPVKTYSLVQTMAERWEVVIDFAKFKGQNIVMKSSNTFADIDYEGTGNLMQFRVGNRVRSQAGNGRLPDTLVDQDLPVDHGTPADQTFTFGRAGP